MPRKAATALASSKWWMLLVFVLVLVVFAMLQTYKVLERYGDPVATAPPSGAAPVAGKVRELKDRILAAANKIKATEKPSAAAAKRA